MNKFFVLFVFMLSFSPSLCRERGLYIDLFDTILGNNTAENQAISFALSHRFTYICLYDVGVILDNGRSDELAAFILKARSQGIQEIGAAGGWTGHFDLFATYQEKFASAPLQQLDAFNLESEFWNDPTSVTTAFANWLSLASYMKKKAGTKKIELIWDKARDQSQAQDFPPSQKLVSIGYFYLVIQQIVKLIK
jgi:hypothetical protein